MKQILVLLVFLTTSVFSFSQSEIVQLRSGDIIDIDEVSVEFVELISDSRCPKSVQCIRAGEAEVLVAIYVNGEFSHEKKLVFDASGFINQKNVQVFASEDINIRGLVLYPYPISASKINPEDYFLEIGIN